MTRFSIYEQIDPRPMGDNKFRIVETVITTDGPKSRLTEKIFPSIDQAKDWMAVHILIRTHLKWRSSMAHRKYKLGDYQCQTCKSVDNLSHRVCPDCGENLVVCNSCGSKWSQEECEAEILAR